MGDVGTSPDPNNRHLTHTVQAVDHTSQISSNGTYELPFGTDHFLLGKAPGWMQNVVSKWQLGGILNFTTGDPLSFTGQVNTITNTAGRPNVLGPLPKGELRKVSNGVIYFDPSYSVVTDPGLAQVSPNCVSTANPTVCNSMQAGYTNKAIQASNGQVVLVNPQPGQVGTLGQSTLRGPSHFYLDMNMVKRFRIAESKTFEFRIDAINILNKANFGNPTTSINSTSFGNITGLSTELVGNGMRSFIVNTRVNF
jgi:hypothetical protein